MKLVPWTALALALTTTVVRADGGVVRGIVTVERAQGVAAGAILVYVVGFPEKAPTQGVVVKQVGKKFIPDLVAVTAGGTVTFPNGDPFLHNVFSQTTARSFDLGSYPKGETRTRTFPQQGVLDVYCNIHPEMNATLVVLPNTKFVMADAAGKFEIKDVPAGTWSVFAYSRRAGQPAKLDVTVTAGAATEIELQLKETQRDFKHKNKYGETYRPTTIYAPGT
jgi:plastocyanin